MVGLKYILSIYNMTNSNLAKKMNINRANISMWVKSGAIPEKKIDRLSEIFPEIPREYFQKELSESDKTNILQQINNINNSVNCLVVYEIGTLEDAITLAAQKHAGQTDKAGQSYILHPLRVMMAMETEEERVVAVLHDILEDTDVTVSDLLRKGFSSRVVEAVKSVTRYDDETYFEFINRTKENEIGRKVKIADLKDNMNWDRIKQPTKKDVQRMIRYQEAYQILASD